MNLYVTGGRGFEDWSVFSRSFDCLQVNSSTVRVYYDGDRYMCSMVTHYCSQKKWDAIRVAPVEDTPYYTHIRNMELMSLIDGALVFWDGKSSEIGKFINLLRYARKRFVVFDYYGNLVENYDYDALQSR